MPGPGRQVIWISVVRCISQRRQRMLDIVPACFISAFFTGQRTDNLLYDPRLSSHGDEPRLGHSRAPVQGHEVGRLHTPPLSGLSSNPYASGSATSLTGLA